MSKIPPAFQDQILFLSTDCYEQTREFCELIMGFQLVLDQGSCCVYETSQGTYLGYCDRPSPATKAGLIITLVVDQVDAWYQHLKSCGISLEHPPKMNETYRIYHFFFRDPGGYLFEIQQFLEPFPPDKESP